MAEMGICFSQWDGRNYTDISKPCFPCDAPDAKGQAIRSLWRRWPLPVVAIGQRLSPRPGLLMHLLTLNRRLPWTFLPLLLILLVGLGLRLYGIDWDSGFGFHPDERDIYMRSGCMYDLLTEAPGHEECGYVRDQPDAEPGLPDLDTVLDPDRSPLNPHWFPLGSILIYVLVFFRSVIELFTDINALDMRFVGRTLSALADVGSILFIFVLGKRMYGQGVGLLAAAFTALAVIHIQNSHFYRPETFSILFTLASFWAMLRMLERRRLRDSALLGLLVGLALAPKVSVLPLIIPLALAYGYRVLDSVNGRWSQITPEIVGSVVGHAAVAALTAVAVFFVTSPYAFLDMGAFLADLETQTNMARNAGIFPFTVQYIDTPAFIYQIQQSSVWGLGLPLGVIAWLAIPFTAVIAFLRRSTIRFDLLLLAWVVPSFLLLESFEVRFLRYVFPLIPFLLLMGSRMLLWLVELANNTSWQRIYGPTGAETGRQFARSAATPSVVPEQEADAPDPFLQREPRENIASLSSASKEGTQLKRKSGLWVPPAIPVFRWKLTWLPVGLIVVVLAATAFYALAFERVYARDHPAVSASQWIKENIPQGTSIVSDNHWDEFVPDLYRYRVWQFPVYEPDTPEKMTNLAQRLAEAQYLVFYSNRPYGSVSRVPDRYPLSSSYYRQLFGGGLGYRLDRTFTSYPELAGVSFRDEPTARAGLPLPKPLVRGKSAAIDLNLGYADDNVVGYDHPRVLLFRNVEWLSKEDLEARLSGAIAQDQQEPSLGLMLSDHDRTVQQSGGTWSKIIDRDSWTNKLPVFAWILVVELAYLAALPLAMFIFRPLPDRGIVLARILGLLGVTYVAWLLVSLDWVGFSRLSVILGFLVVGSLSAMVLLAKWREIKAFLVEHWRLILLGEALFLVAFLAFVALRSANPDLWHPSLGGEKPMELAYFNAVIRSTTLPPFDPWFAGGYLNYYYWGYFLLGGMVRLTGILSTTAFNLAVPLFFALTVTAAFSLVYNLTEGVRRSRATPVEAPSGATTEVGRQLGPRRWSLWSPVSTGLLAGLFISVIGNLDGVVQIVQGTWHKVFDGPSFPAFDFWRSSRMLDVQENFDPSPLTFWIPEKVAAFPDVSFHITEFPFFTFLFADLHAHMMVIPFTLLVAGLGLTLVVGLKDNDRVWAFTAAAALALALGSLWVINSWDYPSYLLVTLALLALAVYFKPGPIMLRVFLLVTLAAGVVAVSLLAFLPFHQSYEAFNSGLDASRWRTPVDRFLGIHGLFLFIIASFLVYNARGTLLAIGRNLVAIPGRPNSAVRNPEIASVPLSRLKWILAIGLLGFVLLAITGFWTAAVLLVLLILTAIVAWEVLTSQKEEGPFAIVPLVLLAMALAIAIGVDFIRVEGDIGRMNTFFKYYLEVWVLLSLASAYMLWHLGGRGPLRWRWTWVKGAWLGVLVLLIGCSLIYTALGSRARIDNRFVVTPATLDGTAYMELAVHQEKSQAFELKWDGEAIRWLQDNVTGSPVVLEAHNESYRWGPRISSYTGLPTVLGWPWHQMQQRWDYQYAIQNRAEDIREIYNTTSVARAEELLKRYEVTYIVIGDLERIYYDDAGLDKFSDLAEIGRINQVFQNDRVSIYQIP